MDNYVFFGIGLHRIFVSVIFKIFLKCSFYSMLSKQVTFFKLSFINKCASFFS